MGTRCRQIFDISNWLTLARLLFAGMLWVAPADLSWLAYLLVLAALSDMLDGRVAKALRKRRLDHGADPKEIERANAIGAWLDPLCDKAFMASTLAAVWYVFQPSIVILILIASREIILVPWILLYGLSPSLRQLFHFDFRADTLGKLTTIGQFAAISCVIFGTDIAYLVALATGLIGIVAILHYLRRSATSTTMKSPIS